MTQGTFSNEETRLIEEFRGRMKGYICEEMYQDDDLFVRFLRARNHNIDAAQEMLIKNIQWRKMQKVDSILSVYKAPEVLQKFFPLSYLGCAEDGSPVTLIGFGNLDAKGLVKCIKKSDMVTHVMHFLENQVKILREQSAKLGKNVDKWFYIFNFENFTLANATDKTTIEVLIALTRMYDANYPERLKVAYIVNASFYFSVLWAVIKPFLSAATAQKVRIFGKEGWKEELRKDIGPDILPVFLGGNRTDPDGNTNCNTFINHGGLIPPRYYAHRDRKSFSKLPGVKRVVVSRRSKVDIKLEVSQAGSNIEWDFDIKNRDIGFSLFFCDSSNGIQELVPKQRIDTLIQSESGMVKCEKSGVYILQFDNTFSWMHNKEIYYSANIINPDDLINEEDEEE